MERNPGFFSVFPKSPNPVFCASVLFGDWFATTNVFGFCVRSKLWGSFGEALAKLWESFGEALGKLWGSSGAALGKLWGKLREALGSFGEALGKLGGLQGALGSFGEALGELWGSFGAALGKLHWSSGETLGKLCPSGWLLQKLWNSGERALRKPQLWWSLSSFYIQAPDQLPLRPLCYWAEASFFCLTPNFWRALFVFFLSILCRKSFFFPVLGQYASARWDNTWLNDGEYSTVVLSCYRDGESHWCPKHSGWWHHDLGNSFPSFTQTCSWSSTARRHADGGDCLQHQVHKQSGLLPCQTNEGIGNSVCCKPKCAGLCYYFCRECKEFWWSGLTSTDDNHNYCFYNHLDGSRHHQTLVGHYNQDNSQAHSTSSEE